MARLEWNGRECVNPPDGWVIWVSFAQPGNSTDWYWRAKEKDEHGAEHVGLSVNTEAEAKRACEAALLRLGVLEVDTSSATYGQAEMLASVAGDPQLTMPIARALAALEVEASHA